MPGTKGRFSVCYETAGEGAVHGINVQKVWVAMVFVTALRSLSETPWLTLAGPAATHRYAGITK